MKSKSFLLAVVAIAAIQCTSPTENASTQLALSPDNVPSTFVDIDPTKDTTVVFPQGTTIRIPANAFIDDAGNVVRENVQLELKECYKRADMILAGLTTEGEDGLLESDGMYYLNGTADGKNIRIADDKPLILAMPTDSFIPDMQAFRGEKQADGTILWKDPQEFLNAALEEDVRPMGIQLSDSNKDLAEIQVVEPQKPLKYDDTDERVLSIEMDDPERFPELAMFQNVKFRVNEKSEFDRKDANQDWYSMDMTRTMNEGEYYMIFGGKDKRGNKIERKYIVNPVYEGSDYQKALKEYEAKYEKYRALKLKRQQTEQKQADYLKRQVELEKNRLLAQQKRQVSQQERLDRTKEILDRAAANQSRLQAERKTQQDSLLAKSNMNEASRQARQQILDSIRTMNFVANRPTKEQADISEAYNYISTVSKFGWINCDRYYNTPTYKVKINVLKLENNQDREVRAIVFMNKNRSQFNLIRLASTNSLYVTICPEGKKTALFFTKKDDMYLAYYNTKIGEKEFDGGLEVSLKEYTEFEFKDLIESLTN